MKHSRRTPVVTSLPQSPRAEADRRVSHYAITMGIRTACFLLMVLVQPYGWWSGLFALAAIFLPYIAVVNANAGSDSTPTSVESPTIQLEPTPSQAPDSSPHVITLAESFEPVRPAAGAPDAAEDEQR